MKLVIATPSPFARKVRVALREKALACEEIVENPWTAGTRVPDANPLGKVPALLLDDGTVVHDSKVIVEYLEALGLPPPLIPHEQIEALADGVCDAAVLVVLERSRPGDLQSGDWIGRQMRKIESGTAELARLLGPSEWFTSSGFGLADIAAACALGYVDLRIPEFDWRSPHRGLAAFAARMDERPAFAATRPTAQPVATGR